MDKHNKPAERGKMSAADSPAPVCTVEEDARQLGSLPSLTRRSFLSTVGAGAALVTIGAGVVTQATESQAVQGAVDGKAARRRTKCRKVRIASARQSTTAPFPTQLNNGEEDAYPFVANFSKGLPHNGLGEVDPAAYNALLKALASGTKEDFEAIPLGGSRKLRNPQSGLAFDLEGPDSHGLTMELVPRIDSAQNSSEMAELYWMALCRDVPFTFYATDLNLIDPAAADLSTFSDYRAPKDAAALFRGVTDGDLAGPYVSQFLLKDIPYGSLTISQRQKTFVSGTNYLTDYASWLANENGVPPSSPPVYDSTPRYIRNGRDLAAYVYVDALYEAYLNACLILLGLGAPFNPGNPYHSLTKTDGFGTFGGPHILSLVTEVATRALKAVWFQKWYVHRRLRPEEFGSRIHNHVTGAASYLINQEVLRSDALDRVHSRYGTYLLPQAFPDACPLHPAYGSGHATVAGACITILKAWFDESFKIPDPVVPNADGTALTNYSGGPLTAGGELNKVASNIANGRDFAGIHWRTDGSEGMKLGEAVAIGLLQEQKGTYNESSSFTFTKLDGSTITI
jgi:hypothetical protein